MLSQNVLLKHYQYFSEANEREAHVSPLVQLVQIPLFSTQPPLQLFGVMNFYQEN